jgi:hypothetical protein
MLAVLVFERARRKVADLLFNAFIKSLFPVMVSIMITLFVAL